PEPAVQGRNYQEGRYVLQDWSQQIKHRLLLGVASNKNSKNKKYPEKLAHDHLIYKLEQIQGHHPFYTNFTLV
ncbi:MAG: hypothetical protein ACQES8_05310, partial [Thermodesulfobacteriota bacterium]